MAVRTIEWRAGRVVMLDQRLLPTREVYHKGPGMFFRGNPQKYLTEIQFPLAE